MGLAAWYNYLRRGSVTLVSQVLNKRTRPEVKRESNKTQVRGMEGKRKAAAFSTGADSLAR